MILFGGKLGALRILEGFTHIEITQRSSIPRPTICRYERGGLRNVDPATRRGLTSREKEVLEFFAQGYTGCGAGKETAPPGAWS
jgi:transcriptional regulator with XRE-family HTH domain